MKVGLAQINTTVGDFDGNAATILDAYRSLDAAGADLVLFPELALCGYPPLDLVFHAGFAERNSAALDRLTQNLGRAALVVGFVEKNPSPSGRPFFNSAAVLEPGQPLRVVRKSLLPTYDVFDEARYFEPARSNAPLDIAGHRVGITICEDIWTAENLPRRLYEHSPLESLLAHGAEILLNLSASPFEIDKPARRRAMLEAIARTAQTPLAYCNAIGGNDQLVFDGHSLGVDAQGRALASPGFEPNATVVDFSSPFPETPTPPTDRIAELHDALVLGIRDYLRKCGFKSCVLGLSGGIDSAVTAALAVRALGPDNVLGVLMPTEFSSSGSIDDALALAVNLGMRTLTLPIQNTFQAVKTQLAETFAGRAEDTTEENIQARLRGLTLMAISNKFGSLLLTTGNKSELAVGYCTLYGDMCGGLAAISDVPKTLVYELARWMNRSPSPPIPENSISKPPSAELRPNQRDQDSLPPYDTLDAILALAVEQGLDSHSITSRGFDPQTVTWILNRVAANEYKRAQAAPGLKVTTRAFGIGRRIPIAKHFKP